MFVFPKSAVGRKSIQILSRFKLPSFLSIDLHTSNKKMNWEKEKVKFLSSWGTRDNPKWTSPNDIETWREFAKKKDLPQPADALPGYNVDSSKNDVLASKVSLFSGDITELKIDAIVNAANKALKQGGGVDGAIHKAAGSFLQAECDTLGGCPTGEARVTGAYNLPSKYVIHTVGPRGENSSALRNCYVNSLKKAVEFDIRTVAFPCISTGIYGYPNEAASHVASFSVRQFLEQNTDKFDRVIFCVFLEVDKTNYERVLQTYFPVK